MYLGKTYNADVYKVTLTVTNTNRVCLYKYKKYRSGLVRSSKFS